MNDQLQEWEREVLARHRWGAQGDADAAAELERLRALHPATSHLTRQAQDVAEQIVSLEICNWRLEEGLLALCKAIGEKRPAPIEIGHKSSVTADRWAHIWSYYLSLREWLSDMPSHRRAYTALLSRSDPHDEVRQHVRAMLGERDELRELRVERLCLHMEFWLDGLPGEGFPRKTALDAAAAAIDAEIERLAPGDEFEAAERGFSHRMQLADNGQLHACHQKLFRRDDIIISSIGCGNWRGVMPYRGTDGCDRADTLDTYLGPIDAWIADAEPPDTEDTELTAEIGDLLGERDDTRVFLASLLVSLLRSQQLVARQWAERAAAATE